MKQRMTILLCSLMACVLSAGCVTSSTTKAPQLPVLRHQAVADDQVSGADMAALTTLELARKGVLPDSGLFGMAPDAIVELMNPEPGFSETDVQVTGVSTAQDGRVKVDVLRKFEDGNGRTQSILDMVVYTLRQPSEDEIKANAAIFVADYKAVMRSKNVEAKKEIKNNVKAFQQQAGLSVDGALGPQTAMAMAKSLQIQEFSMLASAPVYSQTPKFEMHIMDAVLAKNAPDTYLKGFESRSAVRSKAIPQDMYASRTNSGGNFLAVIYYLDQLPRDSAIQLGFSEFKDRKDTDYRATMRPVYATGEGWPVVLAPFKLERSTASKKLYAHVILNGAIVETVRIR